ncbi:mechanosensitive ion channel domain-containing protein [Paenibacillus sp. FSL R7-0337]|uniref:mechanosensitive ion channel family protein n=1 Tax=Paenibacillus sp. FSL R7-0337 TaxID=1926588 RepID=UPI00097006C2|nr:mechanosensitive ion channel domain-containing protein [Paenibacillus sp. FSL R7-0337]OMF98154.1 mechanosensitive ion channel protein MscS [Paenibacillus sp. FSL R7-0337]
MNYIKENLAGYGVSEQMSVYLSNIIMILFIALLSVVANLVAKKIVLKIIIHIINNNRYTWDNFFLEKKVFHKLSHLAPAFIIYYAAPIFPLYQSFIIKIALTYMIIVTITVFNALLDAIDAIYRTYEVSKIRPIRGYIQVAKIILYIIAAIVVISNLMGQNPLILLSGLGALSAVLMLVFKDSILGLVAGVQLSSNDMVRVGDWIEMPKYNADGNVIDITLNTVKVMNFDKTITMIPSYALISDSFKNWRGMEASGGRRMKRSVCIDTSSICFCTKEMIEEFRKVHYLSDYVTTRLDEINAYNIEHHINMESKVNGRQLTNIGVFREYVQEYLRNHPKIHKDMTLIVRQLEAGDSGLPLEIYAFSNETTWGVYESVQSDIFDHIFAIIPLFGLRVFQNPTGQDIVNLKERREYSTGY